MKNLIITFLLRLFNLNPSEVTRVLVSWVITFLHKFAVIIGFTLITVFFVYKFGIEYLPFLFLVHAVSVMLGTFIFSPLVSTISKDNLVIIFSLLSAFTLFVSSFINTESIFLFLVVYFVGLSLFMGQLKIARMLFIESQFTPGQAVRVFPIIESAETFGVIFGGLLISLYATSISFDKFVYIMILALLLIVPIVLIFAPRSIYLQVEGLHLKKSHFEILCLNSIFAKLSGFIRNKAILALVLIVLCQWVFFTLIEYEYTKSVEHISHAVILQSDDSVVRSGFAEDLGRLQVYIGSSALFFQLVLASRLLNFTGIVGGLLLYPIVLFIGIFSYIFNPNFTSLLVARFGHEMTNVIHYNAYHTTYYAFDHTERSGLMEFIEGIIRPMGAVIATISIFVIEYFVLVEFQSLVLSILMLFLLAALLLFTINFKFEFDDLPQDILRNSKSVTKLIDAINLMRSSVQPGDTAFLIQILKSRKDLNLDVVNTILDFIADFGDLNDVSFLMNEFNSGNYDNDLLLDAIFIIISKYGAELCGKPFLMFGLNQLIANPEKFESKKIINKLYLIKLNLVILNGSLDSFLSTTLEKHGENLIFAAQDKLSDINDNHMLAVICKYLSSKNPKVRSATLYILKKYFETGELKEIIKKSLHSKIEKEVEVMLLYILKVKDYSLCISTVAQIKQFWIKSAKITFLINNLLYLKSNSVNKLHILYNNADIETLEWFYKKLDYISNKKVLDIFNYCIESKIHMTLATYIGNESVPSDQINTLKRLYKLLDSKKDYFVIKELLLEK